MSTGMPLSTAVPATDEHEAVVAAAEGSLKPRGIGDQRFWREFDSARTCFEDFGNSGLQRAEIDAVGCGLEPSQGEAVGFGAECVAVGPESKHHVESSFISRPGGQ